MVVHGYRMKQLTMNELQEQIDKLHKKYQLQVKKEYGRLLGEEIAFLCDQIALNVVPKPRISIFEQAKQNLNQQLQVAKMNGTKQNLQVVMYVMPEDEYVYLNVKFHNPVFEKIFKHLEPYSLTEEKKNGWNYLPKRIFLSDHHSPCQQKLHPSMESQMQILQIKSLKMKSLTRLQNFCRA